MSTGKNWTVDLSPWIGQRARLGAGEIFSLSPSVRFITDEGRSKFIGILIKWKVPKYRKSLRLEVPRF
jgi:hypothetical protein